MSSKLMEPQEWAMEDTVMILAGADLLIRSINKYVKRKWPWKQEKKAFIVKFILREEMVNIASKFNILIGEKHHGQDAQVNFRI